MSSSKKSSTTVAPQRPKRAAKKTTTDLLKAATKKNTPAHNITGSVACKVIDVCDGDTCKLAIVVMTNEGTQRTESISARLLGYDAPEMKVITNKPFGTEVRDVLRSLILDKLVIADIEGYDKYHRALTRLYSMPSTDSSVQKVRGQEVTVPVTRDVESDCKDGLCDINNWMITNLPIHTYSGEKKRVPYTTEELAGGAAPWPKK